MYAQDDNVALSRSGMKDLTPPWHSRHIRFLFGLCCVLGIVLIGIVLVGGGAQTFSYDSSDVLSGLHYGWAVPLLVAAASHFSFG